MYEPDGGWMTRLSPEDRATAEAVAREKAAMRSTLWSSLGRRAYRRSSKVTVRTLALVIGLVVAGGCYFGSCGRSAEDVRVDLAQSDVVGTWQNAATDGFLVFEETLEFTASNLPYQEFENHGVLPPGFDHRRDHLPGSGTWKLELPIKDWDGPRNKVYLYVRWLSGGSNVATAVEMRAEMQDGKVVLVFYIGDPDLNDRIVYEKCEVGCPTVLPTVTPS